ncbi:hypothetical protein B0H16DRAFT_1339969, partial [Mycena metata]
CASCNDANPLFRCVECFNAPLWCRRCIVHAHQRTPFHHIEKWDGKVFVRASLVKPQKPKKEKKRKGKGKAADTEKQGNPNVREFTIVDHNRFHIRQIQFCKCTRDDIYERQQLLVVRLFPATWKRPKTAFTFTVMKQFHIHSLTSKKSVYDYVGALCKLTDNVHPQSVTDRYREFLFACRLWRFLALQRRSGQAHNIDVFVPHRRPGSLTIRCPACPEVGFNISEETMREVLEQDRCGITLFVSVDGNFKMQRKNKRDDPNDFALNDGNGYFVETEDYKRYIKVAQPVENLGTCSHLRASRMQNMAKFKNAVVTGVVALQCARHGMYLPQGMVDLAKGEAFACTDYAIVFALAEAVLQRWIRLTYNIWCQYGIKLLGQVDKLFPSMLSIIKKIHGTIPKMLILNHIERCQLQFNLNWLCYCAFTVGEMIETGWAVHNLAAGSTEEMNAGHRHESQLELGEDDWYRCNSSEGPV